MDGSLAAVATRTERSRIIIVGTGFAGLGMAIRLKAAGINDFVVLEKDSGVGGTWRVNNYPGCACDVESNLYSFSFAPNPDWSRAFSRQPEIRSYLEGCVERYGLAGHLRLDTEMESAAWDEKRSLWRVMAADGRVFEAPIFIPAVGGLSRPALPNIKGIKKFKGEIFHSQQWNHEVDLRNKRVAVIGTGASAIQFVPQIQKQVAQLDLYQRTPPWIIAKPDRAVTALEKRLFKRIPALQKLVRAGVYSWHELSVLAFAFAPRLMKLVQGLAERHIAKQVRDPALRAKLTPNYTIGCKRILISNDYYPALTQSNVEVITEGVAEVRANSVVDAAGAVRAVDALILGTGFEVSNPIPPGAILGREGADLGELWKAGPEAYKGTTIHGFPNLFMLVGPNVGLGHNSMVYMIESQINYVLDALNTLQKGAIASVEVKPEAQQSFNTRLQAKHGNTIWSKGGCMSWYLHESGKNTTLWPDFTFRFRQATRKFDAAAYTFSLAAKPRTTQSTQLTEIPA